jgi:hypothetical protein
MQTKIISKMFPEVCEYAKSAYTTPTNLQNT